MKNRDKLVRSLVCAIVCVAFTGCSGSKNLEQLKAFLQKPGRRVSGAEYRVMPPDVILITSRYVSEINNQMQQIRPDGKINLPLVGEIFVAGHTPQEIETFLTKAASDYYEQVDATVRVVGYNSQKIYVFGQVRRPGPVLWTGANTLLDVLAQVQPTELAWLQRIKVVRGQPPMRGGYVPSGKKGSGGEEMMVNLMDMVKSGDLSRNVLLRPDDVVYVPPNPFAAVGLALRNILFPTQPVFEAAYEATYIPGVLP